MVLGSIPQFYDPYVAAITTAYAALNKPLMPTYLIDSIRDEADRHTITSPPKTPRKSEQDMAYVAGQSSKKEKKDGNESKQLKKVKCYNCKNFGHIAKECWEKRGPHYPWCLWFESLSCLFSRLFQVFTAISIYYILYTSFMGYGRKSTEKKFLTR